MKVLVTRHGQTNWNVLGKVQGRTDIELNDIGREQAEKASEQLENQKIDLIITSPLKRAKETAEIINKKLNINIIEDNRLIERGFGKSEGLNKDEMKKLKESNPEMNEIWNYNKKVLFNGIESMPDFCNRIYNFLDDIKKNYEDKTILLVTHAGVSVPIKCYFMKYPLKELVNKDQIKKLENCEIVKFNYE